ncbi:Ig-like domain-containing protein [Paenibacillus sp. YAF4_2]|uniref:Ig-like domain-containing protein n=1 Tax=Paenibacillus sp. YAF4_2 TaxID=3233085 RepID=UPI003F9CD8BC
MKERLNSSRYPKRAACALLALLLAVPVVSGQTAYADAPANTILTPVTGDSGWIDAGMNVNADSFSFDIRTVFPQLTGPITMSAFSSKPNIAAVSEANGRIEVKVKGQGTTRLAITGSDSTALSLTDYVDLNVTLLGDTTGDGLITSADVLYIYKVINSKLPVTDQEKNRLDINRDGVITTADATVLMNNYVGKTPATGGVKFIAELKESNDAPTADQITVTGTVHTGSTLTGSYRYADPENDAEVTSLYQWYRGAEADGSDKAPIAAETSTTYTVQEADVDHYLFFEVTPVDALGANGTAVMASTTGTVPDTTPPVLTGTTPVVQANSASRTDQLQTVFSEPIKAAAGKSIYIYRTSDNQLITSYDAADTSKVTITGSTAAIVNPGLGNVTAYYVNIDAGAFTDLVGNPYEGISGNAAWSFVTEDSVAPVAASVSPVNGAADANKAAAFTLTMDENVQAVAGKKVTILNADQSELVSYDAADASKVTISGKTVTIHNPGLAETTSYSIEVEEGAFTDLSGNAFEGISGANWSFTTPDTIAPILQATTPGDDASGVDRTAAISMTFSEPVQAAGGKTVRIYRASDNSLFKTYNVTDTNSVEVNGDAVTLLAPNLADGADFYIEVDAGAFQDAAGNSYTGLQGASAWNFTTPDTIAPTLQATTPADNASGVDRTAAISMTFSEPVQAVSGKTVRIYSASNNSLFKTYNVTDANSVEVNGDTVTLLAPNLADGADFYIEVDTGAFQDAADNNYAGLQGASAWNFTTPDTIAPIVQATTPADNASGVDRTAAISMTFSEPVQAVSGKTVRIYRASDNSLFKTYNVTNTNSVKVNGDTVTLLAPNLADGADFYIEVDAGAFQDAAGNSYTGLQGISAWNFTTPDTIAPVISSFNPSQNATKVSQSDALTVMFNEPVVPVEGKKVKIMNGDQSEFAVYTLGADAEVLVSDDTLTIQHAPFDTLKSYVIQIEAGAVKDAAGNGFAGITDWSFTTKDSREMLAAEGENIPLAEGTLNNGAFVTLTLDGDTFVGEADGDNYLSDVDVDDFALNHAPVGLTIIGAGVFDAHTAYVMFDYDGTDFDTDITNFSITALSSAVGKGYSITSQDLTITSEIEPNVISTVPAAGADKVKKADPLTMTFDKNITAVAGKKITIYKKSDNSVVETIDAGNIAKVTVSGSLVTIQHNAFVNNTEYYVVVEAGAFVDTSQIGNKALQTSAFRTVAVEVIPDLFISEFMHGSGDNQYAVELYFPSQALAGPMPSTSYSLWIYHYDTVNQRTVASEVPLHIDTNRLNLYLILDNWYGDFDLPNAWYFNEQGNFNNGPGMVLKGIVLKKNGQAIDVLGDPNAQGVGGLLASGGTLVRKSGVIGGVLDYDSSQWTVYPTNTDQFLGQHTP